MEVEHQMMLGCTFCHLIHRIDCLLIITVEEIHLESFDTHVTIMFHDFLHLLMTTLNKVAPRRPEDNPYSILLGIVDNTSHVHLVGKYQQILRIAPSLVNNDIF